MASRRRRVWFRLPIRGSQWTVAFGKLPEGKQGICVYDQCLIILSWNITRALVYPVMWHELGHANEDMSGADKVLFERVNKLTSEDVAEIGEMYMRTFNHAMFETCIAMGWLRLPEIPRWFDGK